MHGKTCEEAPSREFSETNARGCTEKLVRANALATLKLSMDESSLASRSKRSDYSGDRNAHCGNRHLSLIILPADSVTPRNATRIVDPPG
jgi:hypothetical protein